MRAAFAALCRQPPTRSMRWWRVGAALLVFGCDKTNEAEPAAPIEPAALYAQNCARCHGPDGKGDPELKKIMPVRDFTDPVFVARANNEEIERVIMGGRNQMPAFGSMLSLPKIQSVTGHVRRLARK